MTRIEPLDQPLDRAPLARSVRPLDDDNDAALRILERVLQLQQPQVAVLHFLPVFLRRLTLRLVEVVETDHFVGRGGGHGLETKMIRTPGRAYGLTAEGAEITKSAISGLPCVLCNSPLSPLRQRKTPRA